jgi:hypothetical protein
MRRWPLIVCAAAVAVVGVWLAARAGLFRSAAADPRPVPDGDLEVAWLHVPTSADTWENFVWGMKRAEMSAAPSGCGSTTGGRSPPAPPRCRSRAVARRV